MKKIPRSILAIPILISSFLLFTSHTMAAPPVQSQDQLKFMMNPPNGGETSLNLGESLPISFKVSVPPGHPALNVEGSFLVEPFQRVNVGSDWCTIRGSSCVSKGWESLGRFPVEGAVNITPYEPGRYDVTVTIEWANDKGRRLGTRTLSHTLEVTERPGNICRAGLDSSNLPGQSPNDTRFDEWPSKHVWWLWRWSAGPAGLVLFLLAFILPFVLIRLLLPNSDFFEGQRPSTLFLWGLFFFLSVLVFLGYGSANRLASEHAVTPQLTLESAKLSRHEGYLAVYGSIINESQSRYVSWRSDYGRGRELHLRDSESGRFYKLVGVDGEFGATYRIPPGGTAQGFWYFIPEEGICPQSDQLNLGKLQLKHPRLSQLATVELRSNMQ